MSKTLGQQRKLESPNILGMILSPRKQFKLIRNEPIILKPFLIVSFITILSGIILFLGIDFSEDPLLKTLTTRQLFDFQSFNIMNSIFVVIATVIAYSLIHLLAAKVLKSKVKLTELLSMNAHIAIIPAIGLSLNAIVFYIFKDSITVNSVTSLGNLVKDNGMLKAALSSFELFMIWQFIIMALGLHIVGEFTRKSSLVIILLFFFMLVSLEIAVAASELN